MCIGFKINKICNFLSLLRSYYILSLWESFTINFKIIMQIYKNIRKYRIFFQYMKIHLRENLLKYTYIYDIRNFWLDYSLILVNVLIKKNSLLPMIFASSPPTIAFSNPSTAQVQLILMVSGGACMEARVGTCLTRNVPP